MFSWKVLKENTPDSAFYLEQMTAAFPKVIHKQIELGVNLAVYFHDELVGGATLKSYENIAQDPSLSRLWHVSRTTPGMQILRLWSKNRKHQTALPYIFKAILENVPNETFLYGVLALPLSFAKKRISLFHYHKGWLSPQLKLEDCDWVPEDLPTSEGRKLLKLYLSLGAEFLGPPSGDTENHTVRAIMGIRKDNVDMSGRMERYA